MSKYNHYFTKIKDIYLELPGFSYFHSPSGRFRDNPKMVGRKRIKRKLYGLLTNSETKTGSYIITGFRGMGKTSLVNQVINQLQPRTVLFTQAFAVLAIWLVIHFVAKSLEWETLYIFLGIPAFVFVFWSNKLIDGFFSVVNRKYHNTEKEKAKHRQKDYQDGIKTWGARGLRILKRTWKKLSHFFILDMKYYKMSSVSKMLYFLIYGLMVEVLVRILSIDYNMNIGFITLFVFALVVGSHFNKYLAVGFPKVCPVEIRV